MSNAIIIQNAEDSKKQNNANSRQTFAALKTPFNLFSDDIKYYMPLLLNVNLIKGIAANNTVTILCLANVPPECADCINKQIFINLETVNVLESDKLLFD
jgi:hypothetical protein